MRVTGRVAGEPGSGDNHRPHTSTPHHPPPDPGGRGSDLAGCTPGLGWGDWGSRIRFPTACQNGGVIVRAGRRHTTRMAARPAGRGPDGDRVVSPTSGGLTVTQPRRASPGWRFGWQLAAWAKHRQPPPDPGGIWPFVHSVRRILRRFGCRPLGFPMVSGRVRFPPPPLFPVRAIDGHGGTNGV